jgi:hypothetical protein
MESNELDAPITIESGLALYVGPAEESDRVISYGRLYPTERRKIAIIPLSCPSLSIQDGMIKLWTAGYAKNKVSYINFVKVNYIPTNVMLEKGLSSISVHGSLTRGKIIFDDSLMISEREIESTCATFILPEQVASYEQIGKDIPKITVFDGLDPEFIAYGMSSPYSNYYMLLHSTELSRLIERNEEINEHNVDQFLIIKRIEYLTSCVGFILNNNRLSLSNVYFKSILEKCNRGDEAAEDHLRKIIKLAKYEVSEDDETKEFTENENGEIVIPISFWTKNFQRRQLLIDNNNHAVTILQDTNVPMTEHEIMEKYWCSSLHIFQMSYERHAHILFKSPTLWILYYYKFRDMHSVLRDIHMERKGINKDGSSYKYTYALKPAVFREILNENRPKNAPITVFTNTKSLYLGSENENENNFSSLFLYYQTWTPFFLKMDRFFLAVSYADYLPLRWMKNAGKKRYRLVPRDTKLIDIDHIYSTNKTIARDYIKNRLYSNIPQLLVAFISILFIIGTLFIVRY